MVQVHVINCKKEIESEKLSVILDPTIVPQLDMVDVWFTS